MARSNDWAWRETYDTFGMRYGEFIWKKLTLSATQFLRLLSEIEKSLLAWHSQGMVHGPRPQEGALTRMFSHHVGRLLAERFGSWARVDYDFHCSTHKFIRLMLRVRQNLR